ncbi:AAA family ATPase, partial [Evansella sp. AB-rgal1]|uniref:AAA family ATPase n=1 Tax=Evansella sp. AB-rgal1 TaxID=3242696 RepID=UPI00359CF16F
MKPLKLIIKGLHSFIEKQTIDFESLCEEGIFGIFGPTGSGKSTILDAITLALYGEVVRAENKTNGILHHREDTLFVSFMFQLGQNEQRKRYVVERTYKRRGDITIHSESSSFLDITSKPIVLAEREDDVNHAVEELLGLNINDFISAVFLPQENFSEFLLAKGPNRKRLLLSLFHIEKYDKSLIRNLKSHNTKVEQSIEFIEKDNQEKRLRSMKTNDDQKNAYLLLKKEKEELQNIYTLLVEKKQDIESMIVKMDNSREAEKLLPYLKELENNFIETQRLQKQREQAEKDLADYINQVEDVELQFLEAESKKEKNETAIQLEIEELKKVKHQQETVKIEMQHMVSVEKQFLEKKSSYEEKVKLLKIATEERKWYEQKQLELKQKLANVELGLKEKQLVFDAMQNMQDVDMALTRYMEMDREIHNLVRKNNEVESELEEHGQTIMDIEQNLTKRFQQMFHWYNRISSEERDCTLLQNFLRNFKIDIEKENLQILVENLRTQLVVGKPCLVCGANHHEFMEDQTTVSEEQQDISWVETMIEAVQTHRSELERLKWILDNTSARLSDDLTRKVSLPDEEKEHGESITFTELTRRKEIEDLWYKRNRLFLKEKETIEKLIKPIDSILVHYQEEKENYVVTSSEQKRVHEQISKGKSKLAYLKEDFKSKKESWLQRYSPLTLETVQKKIDEIQDKEEQAVFIRKRIDNSVPFILEKQDEIAFLSNEIHELKVKYTHDELKLNFHRQRITELEKEISQVIGNENVNTVMDQKVRQLRILRENYEETITLWNECNDMKNKLMQKVAIQADIVNRRQQKYKLAKDSWEEELGKSTFTSISSVKESLLSVNEKEEFAKRLTACNEFVAEELFSQVSKLASKYLLIFTSGRYEMEVDTAEVFLFRDNEKGGVKRPYYSLSGGEMFLTSLAFSISFNECIQLKGEHPLQCFFIDEGLGTLDHEKRIIVITALLKLSSDSLFSIGVISHDPEVKANIRR